MRELIRLLDAVRRGDGRCVVVTGEPGIGKSRVLDEVARAAGREGFRVLRGRRTPFERDVPFGHIIEAVEPALEGLDQEVLARLGRSRVASLSAVFPSLATIDAEPLGDPGIERVKLRHAFRGLLDLLAAERPVLVALDDLHWADPSSIELIAHLLRGWPGRRFMLLLAYRPALARTCELVGALTAPVIRVELGPLARADVERLLGDGLDGRTRTAIFKACGGNPFYCRELAQGIARGTHDELSPPAAIRTAIAAELELLGAPARALAQGAAVVGDPFDPRAAGEAANLTLGESLCALDELIACGLVQTNGGTPAFAFRHPIVGRAVYENAGRGWLLAAHRRMADAFARRGAPPAIRADHLKHCASRGDEEAIGCLVEAAETMAFRVPASAARWFEAALELLPEGAEPSRRLALLRPLAVALAVAGRLPKARAAQSRIQELIASGQTPRRGRVIVDLARLDHMLGTYEMRPLIAQALHDEPDHATGALLGLTLGIELWHARAGPPQRADAALNAARAAGRPELEAEAATQLALTEQDRRDVPAAFERLDAAERLVGGVSDRVLAARLELLLAIGCANDVLQRHGRATEFLERAAAIAQRTGQVWFSAPISAALCSAALARGRLEAAVEHAKAALEAADALGDNQSRAWACTAACRAATEIGDLDRALVVGAQAVDAAAQTGTALLAASARGSLALAYLEAGKPEPAQRLLLEALGGPNLPLVDTASRPFWYARLADVAIALGRHSTAAEWAGRAEALAQELGLPGRIGDAACARAALLLARDNSTAAARLAIEAFECYQAAEMPLDAARAGAIAGRATACGDDRASAVRWLEQAHRELSAAGAARDVDAVARDLRRLGVVPRRPGRPKAPSSSMLTARESDVAEHIRQGKTNREIARELFISERTVERHLSRIFTKLQIASRAALAAWVERSRQEANAR